jgi:uncharacterized protein (DUF2147 family)
MAILKRSILQLFFVSAFILGWNFSSSAQNNGIEGIWFTDTKEAKIQIYKGGDGMLYGKIIWLKEPLRNGKPKLDDNNPNKQLQRQPIVSLVILKGLKKDGNQYVDGTIYDPENGKTYDCKMTYKGGKTLSIRGYIGISLIGRTTVWERAG